MAQHHRHQHSHGSGHFAHPHRYGRLNRLPGFRTLYARTVDDIVALGLPPGARVLDVGTGPGRVPLVLAAKRPDLRIEGVDLSPEMVEYATTLAGPDSPVRFTVGDVAHLPYEDGTFEVIVSTLSQHHWSDTPAGLLEIGRVLRTDGRVLIYDLRFVLKRLRRAAEAAFPGRPVARSGVTLFVGRIAVGPPAR